MSELNQQLAEDNRRLQTTVDSLLSRWEEKEDVSTDTEETVRESALEMIRKVRRKKKRKTIPMPNFNGER